MLTREEIKNFPRYKYDEYVEKIKECLDYYDSYYAKENKYVFFLANNERINLEFHENNIAHMLGVNVNYLSEIMYVKGNNSYEKVRNFVNDSFGAYNTLKQRNGDLSQLFSQYIDEKLEVFKKVIEPMTPQDIYFISKYDGTRKYQSGEELSYTSDYYIAKKNNEDIILIGVKKEENLFYPQSIRLIKEEDKDKALKGLLTNQVITYANNIQVSNWHNNNYKAFLDTKRSLLKNLINLSNKYGCDVVTSSDHLYCVQGMISKTGSITTEKEILSDLSKCIKEGQVYELLLDEDEQTSLSTELFEIINTCNDLVIQGGNSIKKEENKKLYSELQTENVEIQKENTLLNEKNERLQKNNRDLLKQLEEYKSEISRLQAFQNIIFEAVEKEKTLIK